MLICLQKHFKVTCLILFVIAVAVSTVGSSHAQDALSPFLTITGVDTSQLPLIQVTAYGVNLGQPLAEMPPTLTEDDIEQPIIESKTVDVGVQAGVLLDISANVLPRYIEIADAVDRFEVANLSPETDWLAAYSVNSDTGGLQVLSDWAQDHQRMANELRLRTPVTAAAVTPLFGIISDALDRFSSSVTPANLRRTLIVFSDGADLVSAQQLETIVRKATRLGISIDTVMIGDRQDNANQRNLQQIALETGGSYWDYSNAGKIAEMEAMWRKVGEQREQQQYTYRLTKPQPGEVGLTVALPDERRLTAQKDFSAIDLQPPQIEVINPPVNADIQRIAVARGMPLDEIQPTLMTIELSITWPDGFPRSFQVIEYEIGNRVENEMKEPFDRFNFPIAALDTGSHVLRVTGIDELGIEGKAMPVTFTVTVMDPEPAATPTQQVDVPLVPNSSQALDLANTIVGITLPRIGFLGIGTLLSGMNVFVIGERVVPITVETILVLVAGMTLIVATSTLIGRRNKYSGKDALSSDTDQRLILMLSHARRLAKGFSSPFVVTLFSPLYRDHVIRSLHATYGNRERKDHESSTGLEPGMRVKVELTSHAIDFSSARTVELAKDEVMIHFEGIPSNNCLPGEHTILLSIQDAENNQELFSQSVYVSIADYAFDHVSRPATQQIVSVVSGIGAVLIWTLTFLGMIDQTWGMTSGTAATVVSVTVFGWLQYAYRSAGVVRNVGNQP